MKSAWNLHRQREWVWYNIAIEKGNDQLRQRMAWALAQVLVIARDAIAIQGVSSELLLLFVFSTIRYQVCH